uniref:BTB domain-containing protein n=1 Tax=Panagrolaimus davidi TaxID=227884 RepID=A0A914PV58_9BILA
MAQLNNERFETFKSQDHENGYFDLKFEIEGKIIFAHKFMLAPVSDFFKRMISDIWNKEETIEIKTNSYDDFYEFLTFLYSGNCKLNDENIFSMVDLSDIYHVNELRQKCDEYLSQKEYTAEYILVFFETFSKYSLPLFEKTLLKAIKEKRINLIESDGFLETSKSTVEKFVRLEDRFVSEEKLFEKIYEWAENRVKKKQSESNEEDFPDACKPIEDDVAAKNEKATQTFIFNINDAIKAELTEILPFIKFKKMNINFLIKFVVKRGFLFSYDELSDILDNAKPAPKGINYKTDENICFIVKITNSNEESVICMLSLTDSDIIKNIKSLKNRPSDSSIPTKWVQWEETEIKVASIPSQIKKRDGVEWYLYCFDGGIGVTHYSYNSLSNIYLIAEMTPETSAFKITRNCKIEIE